jgi:hypothetical protein
MGGPYATGIPSRLVIQRSPKAKQTAKLGRLDFIKKKF